jgi:hypothetical protein
VRNIAANIAGARAALKAHGLCDRLIVDAPPAELERFIGMPGASATFAWNRARGVR